ncbi:MAG: hypothetical protein NTW10_08285 [Bacteroidetes bacterium]|nr:hypothetical protein [Bacteroidota bacterium]
MKKGILSLLILTSMLSFSIQAQKKTSTLKDTLDNKFDMSNYIVNLHGFIPWPTIITEPALGSFGIALAAVFISPQKKGKTEDRYRFPDITGVAGMYTLNNTWGVGALRQGSFPTIGMRYTIGAGYANANMDFYRQTYRGNELKEQFNLQPIVAVLDVSENLHKNRIFAGIRYQFTRMIVKYDFKSSLDTIFHRNFDTLFSPPDFNKNLGNLGIYLELDYRNSMFTPDKGLRLKTTYTFGRNWTASDFNFDQIVINANMFIQILKPWVCGFRTVGQVMFNDVPFYYYPYLDMRGIPMMRYQGQETLLFETEQRVDVTRRWSVVGFVGTGRTWSDSRYMSDDTWHWAGGAGFRYLVARLFKLRMGFDVAASKDQFAYYFVFGHYWNR